MKVLYLTTELFGAHGGIARHGRLVLKVLTESPQVRAVDVVALLDRADTQPDPRYFGPRGGAYLPCGGERRAFVGRSTAALLRTPYDMVIAGHVHLAPLLLFAAARRPSCATIVLVYGIDAWVRLPWLRRVSLRTADLVLAISRFTAERATQVNRLAPSRVEVVHCCLDPFLSACEAPGEHPTADGNGHVRHSLLTVSRLSLAESSKGHAAILGALPDVLTSMPNLTYHIVGDGDLKPELERLIARLGIEQHVRFSGPVSDDELRRFYHTCTAYVMPSKWEGFGLVFLEAMAHARPIIAGRRDAAPEILDGAALLVDPEAPDELARALRGLLASPDLQTRLGAAGYARLTKRFTYEQFRASLLGQLQRAAARRAHGGGGGRC